MAAKRRIRRTGLLPALIALPILGCVGVRVYTDHDASVDFASMQSFAWLEPPLREAPRPDGAPGADPFTHNTLLDKRVRDAVEAALVARGYREAEAEEEPDFLLRYEVVGREVVRESPIYIDGGYGYGYRRYGYYRSGVGYSHITTYQEGTLILDVIDPGSERIAWRGWASSRSRDGNIDAENVSRTVDAIVEKFPPGEAGDEAAEDVPDAAVED